jgi:hypothetical protein
MRLTNLFIISLLYILVSCTSETSISPIHKRLVIVYMIADNNLDYFAVSNINDMERGYNSGLNGDLLVYIDRGSNAKPSHPYLMQIMHDTTEMVNSKIIRTYPEQNSADAKNLKQVIEDAKSFGQYSSIGLVLWSHGNAWLPSGSSLYSDRSSSFVKKERISRPQRSFGSDDVIENSKDSTCEMDIKALAFALSGYKFDFLIFDACYMGTIEVAYELRNTNKSFIASPAEILSTGFPYEQIVPLLLAKDVNPSSIAKQYSDYYSSQKGALCSGTISVVNSTNLESFANAVKSLNDNLYARGLNVNSILQNKDSLQQYDRLKAGILFDYKQFLTKEANLCPSCMPHVMDSWSSTITSEYHTKLIFNSFPLDNCNGMSIYLPNSQYNKLNEYYKTLSWYKDSGYDKTLPVSN